MSKLFIAATKNKFRFETIKGLVTLEQLWDMPLTDNNNVHGRSFSLDQVAKDLSKLVATNEESFVTEKCSKDTTLEQKFELVKFIIAQKLDEAKARENAATKKLLRDKARSILAERENNKLADLSDADLKKLAE